MRRARVLGVLAILLAGTGRSEATVLAWQAGTVLHFSNDPATVPPGVSARRFERRRAAGPTAVVGDAPVAPPSASGAPGARWPGDPAPPPPRRPPAAAPSGTLAGPVIIAPTIVVGQASPATVVLAGDGGCAPFGFLPSGFIGHEHPQVGLLAGSRLLSHSHFFRRGRSGLFTPWGHFTTHGLLRPLATY